MRISDLPSEICLVAIKRNDKIIIPIRNTDLKIGDELLFFTKSEDIYKAEQLFLKSHMINKRIFNMLGYVLLFLGVSMIFSAIWSYIDNSDDLTSILNSSLITSIAGLFLIIITQLQFLKIYPYITIKDTDKVDLSHKDGYTLVTLSWVMMTIFGSLPFYLYGGGPFENYIDAFLNLFLV